MFYLDECKVVDSIQPYLAGQPGQSWRYPYCAMTKQWRRALQGSVFGQPNGWIVQRTTHVFTGHI